jgi:hypothetical protein
MEKIIKVKNSVAGLSVAKEATKGVVDDAIKPVLKDIKELEDKGYSNRYQAEGVYWRFKLYEQVVLKLIGQKSNAVKVDVVDVPDASLPVEGDVAEGSSEKTFGNLGKDDLIVKGGVTYKVDSVLKAGVITLKRQSGDQTAISVTVNAEDTLSSKGYTWSQMNN